jgi:DNA-binding transcriptional MerR regulator
MDLGQAERTVLLSAKELAKKLDITPETLIEWREKKLISGLEDDSGEYPEGCFREGETVKKFLAMGYALADIVKIKKEIGLPVKDAGKMGGSVTGLLTVGELAEAGGVNTRTVKFWEEKGLVKPYQRTEGGFRLYEKRDVDRIALIKDLQTFNYTLSEIGNILKLMDTMPSLPETGEGEIPAELEKMHSSLEYLIDRMQETRQATIRVESLFTKRLKLIVRLLKNEK